MKLRREVGAGDTKFKVIVTQMVVKPGVQRNSPRQKCLRGNRSGSRAELQGTPTFRTSVKGRGRAVRREGSRKTVFPEGSLSLTAVLSRTFAECVEKGRTGMGGWDSNLARGCWKMP